MVAIAAPLFMAPPRHPLLILRAATACPTQAAFADLLGVPVEVIQSVESGKAGMTPRLAARIRECTGADDLELLRGKEGRAMNLCGRRYDAASYTAWNGSPRQKAECWKQEIARTARAAGWRQYREAALAGGTLQEGERVEPGEAEITDIEDFLIPWQRCEFASAPAGAWKRVPEALREAVGWAPELRLSPTTRLTLSVQTAPVWNPGAAPPGSSAANTDLFPPCYFTVAAGSAGCRVAAAYWRTVCREHAIDPDTGHPVAGSPAGNWRGFFRDQGTRCEPHAVFAGMDEEERECLQNGPCAPESILCGPADDALADSTLSFIARHSADAGSPAGILLFVSLEGATASTLSTSLLTRLRARYPAMPVLVVGVLPLAGVSQVVAAPWHTALAMRAIRQHAGTALLFSNELLLSQAGRIWEIPRPGYHDVNLLIAECLSALTAPLRFGGTDSHPVDLATILAGFPATGEKEPSVVTAQTWPLAALTDGRLKTHTLPRLVKNALTAAGRPPLSAPDGPGLGVLIRARFLPGPEWITAEAPPEIKLTGRAFPGLHESATVISPSPVIQRTLRHLAKQARELLKVSGAPAACRELGVTPWELRDAIEEMGGPPGTFRLQSPSRSRNDEQTLFPFLI